MQAPRKSRRLSVVAVIAALAAGCSTGQPVELPAPDLAAFAETDAIIVLTEVGGRIRAPTNIISGRGDAANLEMKNVIENCCGHPLALPFLPAAARRMGSLNPSLLAEAGSPNPPFPSQAPPMAGRYDPPYT